MNYEERVNRVRKRIVEDGTESLYVTNLINIRYLVGFTGSSASLLITPEVVWFFSDGRYRTQASEEVVGAEVEIYANPPELKDSIRRVIGPSPPESVGFEAANVTLDSKKQIDDFFRGSRLAPTTGIVEKLRRVKEPKELELIRNAAKLADEGFDYILGRTAVGKTEREIALDLEFHMRSNGADAVSFEPIVAASERSALPHARPTARKVENNTFLLFDLGCIVSGYCSDLTRTIVVGSADDRHRDVYEVVSRANEAAISAARAGVRAADVDKAARTIVADKYPDAFSHGLGHGVGLEIHEQPTLRSTSEDVLEAGEVITIEPGAYFPGWGGVRIEDLAIVTDEGLEILSQSSKALIVI